MDISETFNNSWGAQLSLDDVARELKDFMVEAPAYAYRVTLGTDSELLSTRKADFVTAIVVHRIGNGGRYFWRRFTLGDFHTLRDRIVREALISIEVAKELVSVFEGHDLPEFEFEIHADIGENGPTKQMIQEIVSMIRANNFSVKTKPYSYAASNVADRHV
jgi:predicted RNase H-related nuclease YkuK (DUF458 family)